MKNQTPSAPTETSNRLGSTASLGSVLPVGYAIAPRMGGFAWVRDDGREGVAYASRERAEQSARDYESVSPLPRFTDEEKELLSMAANGIGAGVAAAIRRGLHA